MNLTTSRVTSRLMGIKLLYRMMKVSRLYAKLVEMSPAQTHTPLLTPHKQFFYFYFLGLWFWKTCVCVPTSAGQVPASVFGVLFIPDGGAHRADQSHDQQDAKENQDLHVGHPLHVGALQRRLGGVLERRSRMQHVGKQQRRLDEWKGNRKSLLWWTLCQLSPALTWSRGRCRQQFPQPTGCFWAGLRAAAPGLALKEPGWRQQDSH